MSTQFQQVREIFFSALEREADAREAYVAEACAVNGDLQEQVKLLLEAHVDGTGLLDRAIQPERTIFKEAALEKPGSQIGPYKLLQEIGHGGMGVVYMAEQHEPVRRKVALKIIKPGMDTRQVIARFEAERQALSLMDHPNIARVLDAGTTESGRPYFAMELVKGQPITEYCDAKHLTPRQRLELMVPVCQAIQHAHQKGIIHRDIKPSNILVAEYDQQTVPKVIDFGVAKATSTPLTEKTMFTGFGQIVGTLEYMSPEQAKVNQLDIDTRSDVYSLGVVMYELLTGSTPFDKQRLRSAAWHEMLRIIREEEPPKPSTRLSESKDSLSSISALRQIEPGKLTSLVRGELDWIVMKALDKERNRRYETANGLARDIERYLHSEAVEAAPPTTGYRLKKAFGKHRAAVTTAAAFAVLLLLGTVVSVWQAVRATIAEGKTKLALKAESEQRVLATSERYVSDATLKFFQEDILEGAAPERNARNKKVSVEELVDRAAAGVAGKFEKEPCLEAALRHTIGSTYWKLGNHRAAEEQLSKALEIYIRELGEKHLRTISTKNNLAGVYLGQSRHELAEARLLECLEGYRGLNDVAAERILKTRNSLGAVYDAQGRHKEAEAIYRDVLSKSRATVGEQDRFTIMYMINLGTNCSARQKYSEAEEVFSEALRCLRLYCAKDDPLVFTALNRLGRLHTNLEQYEKGQPFLEEALQGQRAVLGNNNLETLGSMANLAGLYIRIGKLDKAEPLITECMNGLQAERGQDHPSTARLVALLGTLRMSQGQFATAEGHLVPALESLRKSQPEESGTTTTMTDLAELYRKQGKDAEAVQLLQEAFEIRRRVDGDESPVTQVHMNLLGNALLRSDQVDRAIPLFEELLKLCQETRKNDDLFTLQVMSHLGVANWQAGKFDLAIQIFEELLKLCQKTRKKDDPLTLWTMWNLGANYKDAGRVAEALALLEKAYELSLEVAVESRDYTLWIILSETYEKNGNIEKADQLADKIIPAYLEQKGLQSMEYARAVSWRGLGLLKRAEYARAEPLLRKYLEIFEPKNKDHWRTFSAKSRLGQSLLGQQKYAEAEGYLLDGYEGMKAREEMILADNKVRLKETLEAIVKLYEAQGNSDKANEWREKAAE